MENENKDIQEQTEKTYTQSEVNALIGEYRVKDKEKFEKKYADYFSKEDVALKTEELNNKITELGNSLNVANDKANADAETIADLESRVKKYETDSVKIRVALETGIPYELANKLSGETEEEIKADAQKLLPFVSQKSIAPLRNAEAGATDGVMEAFRKLNPNLKI